MWLNHMTNRFRSGGLFFVLALSTRLTGTVTITCCTDSIHTDAHSLLPTGNTNNLLQLSSQLEFTVVFTGLLVETTTTETASTVASCSHLTSHQTNVSSRFILSCFETITQICCTDFGSDLFCVLCFRFVFSKRPA